MPDAPSHILYIRPDTFGDIVLFEPALRELRKAWPNATHTLLVRRGYETLAPLFPSGVNWLQIDLNPFKTGPKEGRALLDAALSELEKSPPDLIVAPTLNRTWFEVALAARFPKARRVALGRSEVDPHFARALELSLKIQPDSAFNEYVAEGDSTQEWESNFRLVDHLLGRKSTRSAPSLQVAAETAAKADSILKQHRLTRGNWIAVFPAGIANVPIKAWQPDRFAEVLIKVQAERKIPALLLGHTSEAATLEAVADCIAKRGGDKPGIWLGNDGEIPLLAALLASSRLYFGHDTGPMHIAAAVGTPVVAIFGGGHWPRFRPVGRQVVSVVQPLPCFGCNWDCHFGDAPCVKTLSPADVQRAINRALDAGDSKVDEVVEARSTAPDVLRLIESATPNYRKLQRDRIDRQHKIEELTHLGREKDVEISELKRAAEERKKEMEDIKAELEAECAQKDTEIADLKDEADTKDAEISGLKKETDSKDVEIGALKKEADVKDSEIGSLKKEADVKDSEIERLKGVCDEREALIFKLTDIVKDFQRQVAELGEAIRHKDARIGELTAAHQKLDAELAMLRAQFDSLPPEAAQYSVWLHDKDVHIRNLENIVVELRGSVENYSRGHRDLEQIKRYSRWLHEKEIVLQHLKRACDERETLIKQLAADSAGMGRVNKAWIAAREYFRLNWWIPVKDWVFKKVVEDQEVQIGILRQYDAKPIQFDKKLPKTGKLPEKRLPAIVVVTPSYNQEKFLESTLLSVFNQNYPKLRYCVMDGGSKDRSVEIIKRYADRLTHWESARDNGQSDAIFRGFERMPGAPDDVMIWLNSDDLIAPRALRFVAEYFASHPNVDAVYGHRIIIDDHDKDIGRWYMPPHDPKTLEWIDYVPQETLFFRRRIYDLVGGLDPSFQFALDWDLLARFQQAKARIVRLPYFLGCFRVHGEQKTSQHIHTTGHEEMTRIRTRLHGPAPDPTRIEHFARKARFMGALTARWHAAGIRY